MQFVNVLDVNVACLDKQGLIALVGTRISATGSPPYVLSYVNAHCYNVASKDQVYKQILQTADLVYADGIAVVWASWFLGGCRLTRLTGADWFLDFCAAAQRHHWSIYLLGGKPGVAQNVKSYLELRFPKLQVVGVSDGFFATKSEDKVVEEIAQVKPDVVFVGLGTPKQEKWINAHHACLQAKVCWSIGALLDYFGGEEKRAPLWMRNLALEWLWRLWVDPRGKWKRYLIGNPIFVFRVLFQKMRNN